MKKFNNPEIEIIDIKNINIVTASGMDTAVTDPEGLLSKSAVDVYGE